MTEPRWSIYMSRDGRTVRAYRQDPRYTEGAPGRSAHIGSAEDMHPNQAIAVVLEAVAEDMRRVREEADHG